MTIGVLHLDFQIPGARSLKDKRRAMKSLKTRMRNRFNCSVAETGAKEQWARSELTVCVVSDDSRHVSQQLNEIEHFASRDRNALLLDYRIELL